MNSIKLYEVITRLNKYLHFWEMLEHNIFYHKSRWKPCLIDSILCWRETALPFSCIRTCKGELGLEY